MASLKTISPQTLGEVLDFMAPYAGGSVPSATDQEYTDWVNWIGNKQDEYARRAFWRRCLVREEITLSVGYTTVLPARFHKPNGLYMLIVDEVDWMEIDNEDEQNIFVEMNNDPEDANFATWQMRFLNEIETETTAIIWYFANPPRPTETTDKLILPGDMVGYAALSEYFRGANQEGSQDKAEEDAENRFEQYLAIETVPPKNELHRFAEPRKHRLLIAKSYYRSRPYRNYQG